MHSIVRTITEYKTRNFLKSLVSVLKVILPSISTTVVLESLTPTFSTESALAFRRMDKSKGSAVTVRGMNDR